MMDTMGHEMKGHCQSVIWKKGIQMEDEAMEGVLDQSPVKESGNEAGESHIRSNRVQRPRVGKGNDRSVKERNDPPVRLCEGF